MNSSFKKFNIDDLHLSALDKNNIKMMYDFFDSNAHYLKMPFKFFERGTILDQDYDPYLTLVASDKSQRPKAFIFSVIRNMKYGRICFIKIFFVERSIRNQGVGAFLFQELLKRASENKVSEITFGPSVPNFWQPGVDLRNTDLYFFLIKHGFRTHKPIFNLTVDLNHLNIKPKEELDNFIFSRATVHNHDELFNFVKQHFPEGTWAEEVDLSFHNDPITSFIVKTNDERIVGWATHSQFFPGSFGPTGIRQDLRGKKLGTELLRWSLWDIQRNGLDTCSIMWVVGETIKFYSKTVNAFISPVFIPMDKKIKN
jgi:GNAT superfamily N-acetyltransferase